MIAFIHREYCIGSLRTPHKIIFLDRPRGSYDQLYCWETGHQVFLNTYCPSTPSAIANCAEKWWKIRDEWMNVWVGYLDCIEVPQVICQMATYPKYDQVAWMSIAYLQNDSLEMMYFFAKKTTMSRGAAWCFSAFNPLIPTQASKNHSGYIFSPRSIMSIAKGFATY